LEPTKRRCGPNHASEVGPEVVCGQLETAKLECATCERRGRTTVETAAFEAERGKRARPGRREERVEVLRPERKRGKVELAQVRHIAQRFPTHRAKGRKTVEGQLSRARYDGRAAQHRKVAVVAIDAHLDGTQERRAGQQLRAEPRKRTWRRAHVLDHSA